LYLYLQVIPKREPLSQTINFLEKYPKQSGIIYCFSRKQVDELYEELNSRKYSVRPYHAGLSDAQRKKHQEEFIKDDVQIIVATIAFGMGINKPNVRFVIHYDLPKNIESYYQEIGRAGRDGLDSLCLLLYDQSDLYTQMEFIKWSNPSAEYYERVYNILRRDIEKVNSLGIDYLREEISFKDRNDFRIETVIAMLDRYGVTEGDIENGNLTLVSELHPNLSDEERLEKKLLNDNKKLLSMVNYFKEEKCRRVFISDYFGFLDESPCGNCDCCSLRL